MLRSLGFSPAQGSRKLLEDVNPGSERDLRFRGSARLPVGWVVEEGGREWIKGRGAGEPVRIALRLQCCAKKCISSVNAYNNSQAGMVILTLQMKKLNSDKLVTC